MPRNPTVLCNCKTIKQWDGRDYRIERVSVCRLYICINLYIYMKVHASVGSMGVSHRRTGNPTGFTRVRYIIFIIFIHLCVRDKASTTYTAAIAVKRFYLPFFRYMHTHTHIIYVYIPIWL